jgi:tetraacyldisaccharide 4'-kinase
MSFIPKLIFPPLSVLYAAVSKARLVAYQRRLLRVSKLDAPVVSVGNLTTGGTGKTPLVEFVCRVLARNNRKVCILTRGYARENPRSRVLVSNGSEILATANDAGDEPFLLAQTLKGVAAVISEPDRFAAGKWAIENLRADVFVLDDGFQHLRLGRDFNILTIDATNPWGGGHLLPFGRLREPRTSASRADCAVITRANQIDDVSSLKEEISQLNRSLPIFTSQMRLCGITELTSGASEALGSLPQPAVAFCAIGNPAAFFDQLGRAGVKLVHTRAFPDHHSYTRTDVEVLGQQARALGARSLITTTKDSVKLVKCDFGPPCYLLKIEISFEEEQKFIDLLLTAVSL